jgi:3-oxoacyl-[acyl-carrier-protein] synthase-3
LISSAKAAIPGILAVSYALGRRRQRVESARLREFGFRTIHVAENETAYDLAKRAAARLLRNVRLDRDAVDMIVYATALPAAAPRSRNPLAWFDYPATRLQYELGLSRANVIGVSQAGCVSLFSAIRVARDVLAAERDVARVLCVGSDVLPRGSRREILYNAMSDGACALLVERGARNRILSYAQVTKGFYWSAREGEHQLIATYFPTAKRVIDDALRQAKTSIDDIKLVLPHNVNEKSWRLLLDLLGISRERLFRGNIARKGHTIAADPFVNLADAESRGEIEPGDRLLLFTFGFGAHWAAIVVER